MAKKPVKKVAKAKPKSKAKSVIKSKTVTKKAMLKARAPKKLIVSKKNMGVKKKFKMPTSVTLITIIMLFLALLSWFIPGTAFDSSAEPGDQFVPGEIAKLGILDVFQAIAQGFRDRADLIVFILALGGFMGLVQKTGVLEAMVGALIRKLNNREILLIPILMFIFAIGGSTFGLAEETLALAIVVVPVFLLAGYDSITALAVLLIGPGIGVMSSTTNPFGLGTAIETISSAAEGLGAGAEWITMGDGIILRAISFGVLFVVTCLPIMWYARRVKKDPSKSFTADINAALLARAKKTIDLTKLPQFDGVRKVSLALFIGAFSILIVSVIPWTDFDVNFFIDYQEQMAAAIAIAFLSIAIIAIINKFTDIKIDIAKTTLISMGVFIVLVVVSAISSDFAVFLANSQLGRMLNGTISPMGGWWFTQLAMLFIVMSLIIAKVNSYNESDTLKTFFSGAKDLFGVAIIIAVSAGVSVILTESGLQYTILENLVNMLDGIDGWVLILMVFLITIPLLFLIPSTSGLAGTIFPVVGGLVYLSNNDPEFGALAATAFMFGTGIIASIIPTSSVVMGLLEIADVGYERWVKPGAIMVGILFVTSTLLVITFGMVVA